MTKLNNSPPLLATVGKSFRRRLMRYRYRFAAEPAPPWRQVLVDVSAIVCNDAGTGIQRVVRALLGQLTDLKLANSVVQPVFASKDHGYCRAKLTADGKIVNAGSGERVLQPVVARKGDIFLGLDLCAHLLPYVEADLAQWRRNQVAINILVYDILPFQQPDWFSVRTARNFNRWLGVLARQADRCICISETVAQALAQVLRANGADPMPEITTIRLGSDVASSYPSRGLPANIDTIREWMQRHTALLSVGTIEPRKGHQQLLAALDRYWEADLEGKIALLVVGRPGWKTKALAQRLRDHPEQGRRLLWLKDASDELLSELYARAAGLVATSHGEGFGLPLVEALAHGTPVLARDLPVFREIGGSLFDYFVDDAPDPFCARLQSWLAAARRPSAEAIAALPRWVDAAAALVAKMDLHSEPVTGARQA